MTEFSVEYHQYGWIVTKDGARVSRHHRCKEDAEGDRDRRARKAASRHRPCITCGGTFLSEGVHHRMCKSCRHTRSEAFSLAI